MWRVTKLLALLVALVVVLVAAPGAASQSGGATQLVISGQVPPGATTGNLDGFGIWVWCEDPSAPNPYAGECAGSIYFYNIALTKFVEDEEDTLVLTDTGFSVELVSPDGSIDCTVNGSLPAAKGPHNTIAVECSEPVRSGTLSNVVVRLT
jgi:hypothetical protein